MQTVKNEKTTINGVEFQIAEFAPLKIAGEISFMTSRQLGIEITSFFKEIFKDYKGTSIKVENGIIKPILWFSRNTNGKGDIEAMVINDTYAQTGETNNVQRWANSFGKMNSMIQGKNKPFVLSENAKKILKAFAPTNANGKVNWDQLVRFRDEVPQQNYFTGAQSRETLMKIEGLSLPNILSIIHGNKKEVEFEGETKSHNISYEITFVQMLHPENIQLQQSPFGILMPNYDDGVKENMLLKITATDIEVMNEVAMTLGAYPTSNNVPMY